MKPARETTWDYICILGEVRKLGIGKITRRTVANTPKNEGLYPGRKCGRRTWDDLVKMYAAAL